MIEVRHNWLQLAASVLETEAEAIRQAIIRLDDFFVRAVDLILHHHGKVVVTGIGKSGFIAQKLSATLNSTGTPAVFLHPSDAFHGDLGIYSPGDPTILISKSGTTAELLRLIPILREFNSPIIGIIGNKHSPIAGLLDIVIDASVYSEADHNNLAPTSSTTVALALGDALTCTIAQARGFSPKDFARLHPGGQLGRSLTTLVGDIAHSGNAVAWITRDTALKHVVIALTKYPLGAACVVDSGHRLVGIITDGDLRRALLNHDDIRGLKAADIMTPNPTIVAIDASCSDALSLMENRKSQISVLPVIDMSSGTCVGLVRIHDIYSNAGA